MKPIIFNSEMIRAIQAGKKSQTRRIIKRQYSTNIGLYMFKEDDRYPYYIRRKDAIWDSFKTMDELAKKHSSYGATGDSLWVRETFFHDGTDEPSALHFRANATEADERWFQEEGWKWKPSIHMPKWAARIFLEITNVRVERVQDISAQDAMAEGLLRSTVQLSTMNSSNPATIYRPDNNKEGGYLNPVEAFENLWNKINSKRGYSWESNPYVFVIDFKKIDTPEV